MAFSVYLRHPFDNTKFVQFAFTIMFGTSHAPSAVLSGGVVGSYQGAILSGRIRQLEGPGAHKPAYVGSIPLAGQPDNPRP